MRPTVGRTHRATAAQETCKSCARTLYDWLQKKERRRKHSASLKINGTSRDTCTRSCLTYLFIAIIYTRFSCFFFITLLAQLYFYTVHIHNASFTLYMHTLREYPRCLKVIVNFRNGRNIIVITIHARSIAENKSDEMNSSNSQLFIKLIAKR